MANSWHNVRGKSEGKDIRCPHCNCAHCPVRHTEKREVRFGGQVRVITRSKRVCRHCQCPFTTVETYENEDEIGKPDMGDDGMGPSPPKKTPPPKNPYL